MSEKFIYTILMAQGIAIILLGIGIISLNLTAINYGNKLEQLQQTVQKLVDVQRLQL